MNAFTAFLLGMYEFRLNYTSNCSDYSYDYDKGRDFAHFLTLRYFEQY